MSGKQNKKLFVILMFVLLFNFILFSIPVLAEQKNRKNKKLEVESFGIVRNTQHATHNIEHIMHDAKHETFINIETEFTLQLFNKELETNSTYIQPKNIFCIDAKPCISATIEQGKNKNIFNEILTSELPVFDKKNFDKTEKEDLNEIKKHEKKIKLQNNLLKTQHIGKYIITAYNSEKSQCDNSPCITANGFNVCNHNKEDTIAANFLKLGTKVQIPDLFGSNVFIVRDRMHKRHSNKVDVWMINKQDAIKFGVKIAKIKVLE